MKTADGRLRRNLRPRPETRYSGPVMASLSATGPDGGAKSMLNTDTRKELSMSDDAFPWGEVLGFLAALLVWGILEVLL